MPFGVEREGMPIQKYPLSNQVQTGITFRQLIPGVIAPVEEREASLANGYTWKEWLQLSRGERAEGIAHYRIHRIIEMHGEDAVSKESERRARIKK